MDDAHGFHCSDMQLEQCQMVICRFIAAVQYMHVLRQLRQGFCTIVLHCRITHALVVADVLHSVWSELSHKGIPTALFIGLWPHCFHKIMTLYQYSICLVSTTMLMMPLSHNISAILTHMSYILFLTLLVIPIKGTVSPYKRIFSNGSRMGIPIIQSSMWAMWFCDIEITPLACLCLAGRVSPAPAIGRVLWR